MFGGSFNKGRFDRSENHQHYDTDGQRFLKVQREYDTGPGQLNLILNWIEELKAGARASR